MLKYNDYYNRFVKPFRQQIDSGHPDIPLYIFTDREASNEFDVWMRRYQELTAMVMQRGAIEPAERSELKELKKKITDYKEAQRDQIQSVLAFSAAETNVGHGQDNLVKGYSYKSKEKNQEKEGSYVLKYSVETYPVAPETVEYLRKKYKMLKRFLGDSIPKTYFLLGERRVPLAEKMMQSQSDNRVHAITIQRRVDGKTFAQMTPEERTRPEVIEALREAHAKYVKLKSLIIATADRMGFSKKILDAKLDIGGLSKKGEEEFNPEEVAKFASPNVMYDEKRKKIYFVDFGMSDWNKDKETIYREVMRAEPEYL